jgi:very-short-patch-repair endonuclease
MKYPGHPSLPPSWYKDRGQSHIEKEFTKELNELADSIESEHWFGDSEKHSRYRVDFLLKDARLIIELDGHDYHSSKEQLEKDAIRQRYLSRAGYTVIRFTGREINRSAANCVSEVRTIYKERLRLTPAKYRAMYIDYPFLHKEMSAALNFYRDLHPQKQLSEPPLEKIIPHAIEWLHEKSFITVFVFHTSENPEIQHLDNYVSEYEKGEIRINTISEDLYSAELGMHLTSFSHLFDEFYLVADDQIYEKPLRSVLPINFIERQVGSITVKHLGNCKLLRKGNEETAFSGTELAMVLWQDVWYVIGTAMGLEHYEL